MLSRRDLLLAAAALGFAGCKGAQRVEVAVTKPIEIRPVADEDPWVAALGRALQSAPRVASGPIVEVERGSLPQTGDETWTFRAKTPRHLREAIDTAVESDQVPGEQPGHLSLVFEPLIDRGSGDLHTAYFIVHEGGFALEDGTRAALLEDGPYPVILLRLTDGDAHAFHGLTKTYQGKRLAMIVDGVSLSAPIVHEPIEGGELQLTFGPPSTKQALRQQFEALTR